jgi:phosphoglycolate phosphatase
VNALGMAEFFKAVYGGNSFETKKPDPLGVHMLLKEFNVRAEEAVIIGDSDIDMRTGKNAGIWSVGVTYGLSPETLVETPGDVMVDAASEWLELF